MKYTISILSLIFLLAACKLDKKSAQGFLNTDKLNSQFAAIRTDRDTELVLQSGTRIFVPKDALQSKSQIVKLELKEAITMQQIIAAGLYTQSNGKALSSGGMVYINAAEGEEANIVKPIKIQVPTVEQAQGMQLFKGEETDEGINWENPQPINIPKDTQLELGKALYTNNCQSCHDPLKDATGPALYESMFKYGEGEGKSYLNSFIRNSPKLIAEGNPYATCIYEKWGKTAMTCFPNLSDGDIDAIYYYVGTEGRERLGADTNKYLRYTADSCFKKENELIYLRHILSNLEARGKPILAVDNTPDTSITAPLPMPLTDPPNDTLPEDTKRYINPETASGEFYNIEINTFGWYNIDIFIEKINGVKQSELFVRLTGNYESKMQVLLFIPSHKVMVKGGLLDDGITFGFKETNGKLPLMQGVQAYILALGENPNKEQLYIGTASFITSQSQTIEVPISATDSTKMKLRIDELHLQNANIKITKDATQPTREALKKEIERLEEDIKKGCDCLTDESLTPYYSEEIAVVSDTASF